ALDRFEQLGLEREAATSMQRLGQMALGRHRLGDADTWLQKAVTIVERLDLARDTATIMQSLGQVAQARQRLDEAERWQSRALAEPARVRQGLGRVVWGGAGRRWSAGSQAPWNKTRKPGSSRPGRSPPPAGAMMAFDDIDGYSLPRPIPAVTIWSLDKPFHG